MSNENTKLKKTLKSEQQAKAKYRAWCEKFFGHVRPAYISNNISVPAFNKPSDIKYLDSLIQTKPNTERTTELKGGLYENIKTCLACSKAYKAEYKRLDTNKLEDEL